MHPLIQQIEQTTMNAPSLATCPVSLAPSVTQKHRVASTAPTDANSDDYSSESSSSSSSDGDTPRKEEKPTTAGLFIQHPDKPLPLSSQRTVPLPIHRIWRKHGEVSSTTSAPDILRKTRSGTSLFSNDSSPVLEQGDTMSNNSCWACSKCNQNNRKDTLSCSLCGTAKTNAPARMNQRPDDRPPPRPQRALSTHGHSYPEQRIAQFSSEESLPTTRNPAKKEGARLVRSKSADYDRLLHSNDVPGPPRRAASEVETEDYVNYSSGGGGGMFSFLRGTSLERLSLTLFSTKIDAYTLFITSHQINRTKAITSCIN